MPATPNNQQAFSKFGVIGWCQLKAANTAADGTGTLDASGTQTTATGHLGTVLDTGSSSGPDYRVERVRVMCDGASVPTVLRLFINNGSTNATPSNNAFVGELHLPSAATSNIDPINGRIKELPTPETDDAYDVTFAPIVVPAGYKLMACLGTATGGGFWHVIAFGGKYA